MLAAMRKAAEKRVEGVTKKKRRRHYDHAAQLVAVLPSRVHIEVMADCGDRVLTECSRVLTHYSRVPHTYACAGCSAPS